MIKEGVADGGFAPVALDGDLGEHMEYKANSHIFGLPWYIVVIMLRQMNMTWENPHIYMDLTLSGLVEVDVKLLDSVEDFEKHGSAILAAFNWHSLSECRVNSMLKLETNVRLI